MISNTRIASTEEDNSLNSNPQVAVIMKTETRPTASSLIRWTGLAAMGAGIIFAAIQPVHPADVVASVTTPEWAIITSFKTAACLLFLLGFTGLYARQVKKIGWLGLAGFLLLGLSWSIQLAFVFAEAFIFPPLAAFSPQFVDALLAVPSGRPVEIALGAVPALYEILVGVAYMLGGLLFGIATFRAGILPRLAAGLMAVASALTPLAALFPHNIQRYAAVPVGLTVVWMGYALWSERRVKTSEAVTGAEDNSPLLYQATTK